jgi:hypothetical protein
MTGSADTDISMHAEYQNVMPWASRNKLTINDAKTKVIVCRCPHFRSVDIQLLFTDIVTFDEAKLLDVVFTINLIFNEREMIKKQIFFIRWQNHPYSYNMS